MPVGIVSSTIDGHWYDSQTGEDLGTAEQMAARRAAAVASQGGGFFSGSFDLLAGGLHEIFQGSNDPGGKIIGAGLAIGTGGVFGEVLGAGAEVGGSLPAETPVVDASTALADTPAPEILQSGPVELPAAPAADVAVPGSAGGTGAATNPAEALPDVSPLVKPVLSGVGAAISGAVQRAINPPPRPVPAPVAQGPQVQPASSALPWLIGGAVLLKLLVFS